MPTLTGKTALVTGASRGMGRASALALAAAGAQVLVHYGRGAKEADAVVAEIRKGGGRADAIAMDLAPADGAGKLARQARSIIGDRLDILVANAGVSKAATIEEMTVQISTSSLRSMSARRISSCSSCFQYSATAAA
jgi:NAD(P)-dependent dehydrogenase (short-subunit alcohol dehydrogenase family)